MAVTYRSSASAHSSSRRGSSRRASSSVDLPLSLKIDPPRSRGPQNSDSFSYSPNHLSAWYISGDVWDRLPLKLRTTLASLQHAGAAVLTGYERLEQHSEGVDNVLQPKANHDELDLGDAMLSSPALPGLLRSSQGYGSPSDYISSPVFTSSSSSSGSLTPSTYSSQAMSPVSPICLTPADASRPRERSFSTPLEPHDAYYTTELSHLRTEAIPRLRHAARKVEVEWKESTRAGAISDDDNAYFEKWWSDKKSSITSLYAKCQRVSLALGISPNGMGWSAP
ncbi:hypothetical protein P154DRAFT_111510 [Amniculicola lignicola CBS 123094]|uniref:Uncharacterized protein n=1 Tax=Amniculicola lignicola CBS 123094 TaxID=1392246 RepID=A0A6A5WQF3_9PLEO|nr:hypothetical protein P154DRAFT_111510 [Amniculicola lignicola CBS 123094]